MDKIYQQLLDIFNSFDFTSSFSIQGSKRDKVKRLQNELCDVLKSSIRSMTWETEHNLSFNYNDSADIFGLNNETQVIIELDTTRADQVAKKMLSRFYYCFDTPTIYISLLYPGTKKMNVHECEKYFKYGKKILAGINKKTMFVGIILEQVGETLSVKLTV